MSAPLKRTLCRSLLRNDASAVKQEFLVLKRVPELVTSVACGRAMQERGRLFESVGDCHVLALAIARERGSV